MCGSFEIKCGSKTDPEKMFCLTGNNQDICPKNSISFGLKSEPVQQGVEKDLENGWKAYIQADNDNYSPLAFMKYSFSRPCGDINGKYDKRPIPIHNVYNDPVKCDYEGNFGPEHDLYYPTQYKESEYDVYE